MIIIYGSRFFGKVDSVPGVFHVATKFGHIYYLPLIPEQTFLVLERTPNGIRGIPIALSWKSMFIAWTRVGFGAIAVIALISLISLLNGHYTAVEVLLASLTMLGGAGLVIWSYLMHRVGRASYERAIELADYAKFSEEGMIAIGEALGKLSPADATAARKLLRGARAQGAVITMSDVKAGR